ncbi:MAG: MBL fold metallo-hydrolase [Thermoanaerobaculales bacterium]|nr:MBL fold metallo-hydrolase [Thermoanaerobaculales bacterium]
MKVTALIENNRVEERDDLCPEFGLSLHIQVNGSKILFDMGSSAAFADNAEVLGINIADVGVAVVSHHHFDHGGGLEKFFELNDRALVFLRQGPRVDRFFKAFGVVKRPIGLDLDLLDRYQRRIEYVDEMRVVAPGVYLLTGIGSAHQRPRGNRRLFMEAEGSLVPDPFDHELMMVIHEDDGMVVFSGCSHHGILNIIDAARAQFPRVPIKAVFGGFHLIGLPFYNSMAASRAEVRDIGWQVMDKVEGAVYSGHCTGKKAFDVLAGVMGENLKAFPTGARVEV